MKYNYLKLAKYIKEKREEKGLSIRKLAENIEVSHTEISRIEGGMKSSFSFITLVNICKELDIDVINLMDDVGIWEADLDQLFYVMFKQDEEKIFKIHARCEGEAIRIAFDFVCENDLIDFEKSDKNLLMGAVKNLEDFNKKNIENFEKIGQLYDDSVDNIEDENSDSDDIEEEKCSEDCIYYCPNCGNCTARD